MTRFKSCVRRRRAHEQLASQNEQLEVRLLMSGTSTPVLDDLAGALGAYGLRRLSSSYSGSAIEVRRASDNATTAIGFTAGGALDTLTLDTFAGTGDVYVSKWYDQSGSGANLTQSNSALQPLIVLAGEVLTDSQGLPWMHFTSDVMTANSAAINNHDLTAFFVQQSTPNPEHNMLLRVGARKFEYQMHRRSAFVTVDGISLGDVAGALYPDSRTLQIVDSSGQTVRIFRNASLMDTKTHSIASAVSSSFQLGSYVGYVSEALLYPSLSDADRAQVYDDVNAYHSVGPSGANVNAILPQDWQYQVDLYDWLETITHSDVTTSPANLQWDGTYGSTDALANLWLGMTAGQSEFSGAQIIRADAKWFLLNDGSGAGIEATGTVKLFRFASQAAFWYSQDLTLAGGGQGNPYYQDPALGVRALVSIAVDMIMHDRLQDGSTYWSNVDFAGGTMLGWMWAYQKTRHLISAEAQTAFEAGFAHMTWKILRWGPHDVNGNMDMKAIAAMAHVHEIVSDPSVKDMSLRAAKKILFGSETGTPETTNWKVGLYKRAGYIDEGDSPETTYNGASLYYLLEAHTATRGRPEWAFLDTVLDSMLEFKLHQYFPDPDGFWDGPSGYASRTGGSYVYDQRDKLWRDITAAASFVAGRPLVRNYKFGGHHIPTESGMVNGITTSIGAYNRQGTGASSTSTAPNWSEEHWPAENLYFPADGWYTNLRALLDSNDPSSLPPYARPDSFSRSFDDEFWAYRNTAGPQEFGFFIESLADPGHYDGWYGGSLQAFWTKEAGTTILARHNKAGDEPDQNENTRVWSKIDTWATHHIWGRDEHGRAFSSAATDGHPHNISYGLSGATPAVEVRSTLGGGSSKGQQTSGVLEGSVTFTNRFEATDVGLRITHTIDRTGADQLSEFWATLPIFLRDTDQNMPDTTIEYWDGNWWQPLGTTLVVTDRLRLGRDFGDGRKFTYVQLDQVQRLKLSSSVWVQSYQANSRIRNIHIALDPNAATSTLAMTISPQPVEMPFTDEIVVSAGPGGGPVVTVFDTTTGQKTRSFLAFDQAFRGGITVATGDLNGDTFPEIIAGVASDGPPAIRVFDGASGAMISSFLAFPSSFQKGVKLAVGDVTGDGTLDVIVGANAGGGPAVRVFNGLTGAQIGGQFFGFDPRFRGGVNIATGDVDGNGTDEIIVGAGSGGGPAVRIFEFTSLAGVQIGGFFAFPTGFKGGVFVSAGDIDEDGQSEIIAGAGPGGGPAVRMFESNGTQIGAQILAFPIGFRGGVHVATGDVNGDSETDIIVGAGPGGGPAVRAFDPDNGNQIGTTLFPFPVGFRGGVFVAGRALGLAGEGSPLTIDRSSLPLAESGTVIDQADLPAIIDAAQARFSAVGLSPELLTALSGVQFFVTDLGGDLLGLERRGMIYLDDDAAGYGWFVDYSPLLDEEFFGEGSAITAIDGGAAAGRIDLLTAVLHELGHTLGLEHGGGIMNETLSSGVRRLLAAEDLDALFAEDNLLVVG